MIRSIHIMIMFVSALAMLAAMTVHAAARDLINTASASGTAPGGATVLSPEDSVALPVVTAIRTMTVAKTGAWVDAGAPGFNANDTINWTVTVQNTGNVTISAITVADSVALICAPAANNTIATLAPGASASCIGSSTVLQSDIDTNGGGDGDIDNSATASGSAPGSVTPVSATGAASVPIVLSPSMSVVKTAYVGGLPISLGGTGTTPVPANRPAGTVITYVYEVTNTGNSTITNVTMADVHNGLGASVVPGSETGLTITGGSTDATVNGSWDALRPGDVIAFSATYTLTQNDVDQRQ